MDIDLKLNRAGVRELLHSSGVVSDLEGRARRVAAQAGSGLDDPEGMAVVDAADGRRARFIVVTTTAEAMAAEGAHRVLTAAIDAAR